MPKFKSISLILFILLASFFLAKDSLASSLPYVMRGMFLIDVDSHGEAWYVDTKNTLRHSLANNIKASEFLKQEGLGISNANLNKIAIAVNPQLVNSDKDGDGLDDKLELAIGTDPNLADTDGDGFPDGLEILNHFSPLGKSRMNIDNNLVSLLKGRILIQVEGKGEAWYVNPKDGLRYYIDGHQGLFKLISVLGQGISNTNLQQIVDSELIATGLKKSIKVDVGPNQRVYYLLGDKAIGSFSVSSGLASMPTPKGNFSIINKHPKAWSPYGLWMPYWLGMGTGSFGFHELPIWPSGYREGEDHLGRAVSHGCIRLGIGPAEFLYNWVEVGTPVLIY